MPNDEQDPIRAARQGGDVRERIAAQTGDPSLRRASMQDIVHAEIERRERHKPGLYNTYIRPTADDVMNELHKVGEAWDHGKATGGNWGAIKGATGELWNGFLGFLGSDSGTALSIGTVTAGLTALVTKSPRAGLGVGLVLGLLDYFAEKEGWIPNLKKMVGTTPAPDTSPAGH